MSGSAARARRRSESVPTLPPALRAELRARVAAAAGQRDAVLGEAKRQRRETERTAAETFERIRAAAQTRFEAERYAIRQEIEGRAALS